MSMPHSLQVGAPSCALLGELDALGIFGAAIGIAGSGFAGAIAALVAWASAGVTLFSFR